MGRRECHVKMETETGVKQPEANEHLEPPEAGRNKEGSSPTSEPSEETQLYRHLDFGLLDSRTNCERINSFF